MSPSQLHMNAYSLSMASSTGQQLLGRGTTDVSDEVTGRGKAEAMCLILCVYFVLPEAQLGAQLWHSMLT